MMPIFYLIEIKHIKIRIKNDLIKKKTIFIIIKVQRLDIVLSLMSIYHLIHIKIKNDSVKILIQKFKTRYCLNINLLSNKKTKEKIIE